MLQVFLYMYCLLPEGVSAYRTKHVYLVGDRRVRGTGNGNGGRPGTR